MISAATASTAVLMITLVRDHWSNAAFDRGKEARVAAEER
jgi:hypothetical protein